MKLASGFLDHKSKPPGQYVSQCKICGISLYLNQPHRFMCSPYPTGISHTDCITAWEYVYAWQVWVLIQQACGPQRKVTINA